MTEALRAMNMETIGASIVDFNRTIRDAMSLYDSGQRAEIPEMLGRCAKCIDTMAGELSKAPAGYDIRNLADALAYMRRKLAEVTALLGPTLH